MIGSRTAEFDGRVPESEARSVRGAFAPCRGLFNVRKPVLRPAGTHCGLQGLFHPALSEHFKLGEHLLRLT